MGDIGHDLVADIAEAEPAMLVPGMLEGSWHTMGEHKAERNRVLSRV